MSDADAAVVPEAPPVKRGPGRPRKYQIPVPAPGAVVDQTPDPSPVDDPISPAAFAERFYGNNPNLLQVLDTYPNKERQAASLFRVAYRAYLYAMVSEVPALEALWTDHSTLVREVNGR